MKKSLNKITTMVFTIVFLLNMNIVCAPGESNNQRPTPYLQQKENTIRIMSYNILADSMGFDGLSAYMRENLFKDTISSTSPDVLCLQEVSNNWYGSLEKNNFNLQFTAPVRNRLSMCMTPILYNNRKLTLLNSGIESYSCSFDSWLRCISWGYFQQKNTNSYIVIINTHLSLYDKNQYLPLLQATELLNFINLIKEKYNCPVIVAGDFNTKQRGELSTDSATYEFISLNLTDSRFSAENIVSYKEKGAYAPINDYIFFTGNVVIACYTLLSIPQLKTISDHYPVFADVIVS